MRTDILGNFQEKIAIVSFLACACAAPSHAKELPACTSENVGQHCTGVVTAEDGNKYVGEMKGGKANGKGSLVFTDGKTYEGQFRDGSPNGKGTVTHPDGETYTGTFKDGKKDGQGKLISADGKTYVGQFKNDQPNGKGTVVMPDGKKFTGTFVEGEIEVKQAGAEAKPPKPQKGELPECDVTMAAPWKHCLGALKFPNGDVYLGEFRDGKATGRGTITFASGGKYDGEFRNGVRHGKGTFTIANGESYSG